MNYQTESKFQNWRALAVFDDGSTCLLFVGRSTTQVRAGYADAFADMLDEAERGRISRIVLQCWQGAADKGHWVNMDVLRVPGAPSGTVADAADQPTLLPFRKKMAPAVAAEEAGDAERMEELAAM